MEEIDKKKDYSEEFKATIDQQLERYCRENPGSDLAVACKTEDGFEDVALRLSQVIQHEFRGQKVTVYEAIAWLELNDIERYCCH